MHPTSNPLRKPSLIYDGDCGFCLKWVERWKKRTGDRVTYLPLQEVPTNIGLTRSALMHAVHFIEELPEGRKVSRGAEAVFRLLIYGGSRWLFALYEKLPGFAPVSEWVYKFIARHRATGTCTVPRK